MDSAPTIDFDPAGLTYETETALSMLVPTSKQCESDIRAARELLD
jgi:hypothetical protein